MKFLLLSFLVLLISIETRGQEQYLTDARDGQQYLTAEVNGSRWMLENLNYLSTKSIGLSPAQQETYPHVQGRYYHQEELDSVCPTGWRLPGMTDWLSYFEFLGQQHQAEISYKSYRDHVEIRDYDDQFQLFAEDSPLHLKFGGIYEGDELIIKGDYVNYWLQDLTSSADMGERDLLERLGIKRVRKVYGGTSHIHLGHPWTQIHSHEHHLDPADEASLRRFMVRCIEIDQP